MSCSRTNDLLGFPVGDRERIETRARRALIFDINWMGRVGLSPNATKARITPPGSRKIVLGLLFDGKEPRLPRLPREFKENLRRHLHYLAREDVGPIAHARARGFASTTGLRHHVEGLLGFAKQIEPDYARCLKMVVSSVQRIQPEAVAPRIKNFHWLDLTKGIFEAYGCRNGARS